MASRNGADTLDGPAGSHVPLAAVAAVREGQLRLHSSSAQRDLQGYVDIHRSVRIIYRHSVRAGPKRRGLPCTNPSPTLE